MVLQPVTVSAHAGWRVVIFIRNIYALKLEVIRKHCTKRRRPQRMLISIKTLSGVPPFTLLLVYRLQSLSLLSLCFSDLFLSFFPFAVLHAVCSPSPCAFFCVAFTLCCDVFHSLLSMILFVCLAFFVCVVLCVAFSLCCTLAVSCILCASLLFCLYFRLALLSSLLDLLPVCLPPSLGRHDCRHRNGRHGDSGSPEDGPRRQERHPLLPAAHGFRGQGTGGWTQTERLQHS